MIGNYRDAQDLSLLQRNGVSHVLCSAGELGPVYPGRFVYKHVTADDDPHYNLSRHFDHAADFIRDGISSGGTVFVHCAAGISRSVSLACAYLLKHEDMKLGTAMSLIKGRRYIANPNPGFMRQLRDFESKLQLTKASSKQYPSYLTSTPNRYSKGEIAQRNSINRLSVNGHHIDFKPETSLSAYGYPAKTYEDLRSKLRPQIQTSNFQNNVIRDARYSQGATRVIMHYPPSQFTDQSSYQKPVLRTDPRESTDYNKTNYAELMTRIKSNLNTHKHSDTYSKYLTRDTSGPSPRPTEPYKFQPYNSPIEKPSGIRVTAHGYGIGNLPNERGSPITNYQTRTASTITGTHWLQPSIIGTHPNARSTSYHPRRISKY